MKSTKQLRTKNKKNIEDMNSSNQLIFGIKTDFILWTIVAIASLSVCFLSAYCPILLSSDPLKSIFVIFSAVTLLFIAKFTTQGKRGLKFLIGARVEMRKVTWPTYREIINSTFVIIVAVSLSSVIVYLFGFFFMCFMHWILK
jgi:preprotein translocase SecE subunit